MEELTAGDGEQPKNAIIIDRSPTTRVKVHLITAMGKEWVAVCMEKQIRDKWIVAKSIQLLPSEWAVIREISIAE